MSADRVPSPATAEPDQILEIHATLLSLYFAASAALLDGHQQLMADEWGFMEALQAACIRSAGTSPPALQHWSQRLRRSHRRIRTQLEALRRLFEAAESFYLILFAMT